MSLSKFYEEVKSKNPDVTLDDAINAYYSGDISIVEQGLGADLIDKVQEGFYNTTGSVATGLRGFGDSTEPGVFERSQYEAARAQQDTLSTAQKEADLAMQQGDISWRGLGGLGASAVGSVAPSMALGGPAGAVFKGATKLLGGTGKTLTAAEAAGFGATGIPMIGGAAKKEVEDALGAMSDQDLSKLAGYNITDTSSRTKFIQEQSQVAHTQAGALGFFTMGIGGPALQAVAKGALTKGVLKGAVTGGAIEGTQEFVEEGGQARITNPLVGKEDWDNVAWRGTLGALGGTMAGAPIGAVGGFVGSRSINKNTEEVDKTNESVFDSTNLPEVYQSEGTVETDPTIVFPDDKPYTTYEQIKYPEFQTTSPRPYEYQGTRLGPEETINVQQSVTEDSVIEGTRERPVSPFEYTGDIQGGDLVTRESGPSVEQGTTVDSSATREYPIAPYQSEGNIESERPTPYKPSEPQGETLEGTLTEPSTTTDSQREPTTFGKRVLGLTKKFNSNKAWKTVRKSDAFIATLNREDGSKESVEIKELPNNKVQVTKKSTDNKGNTKVDTDTGVVFRTPKTEPKTKQRGTISQDTLNIMYEDLKVKQEQYDDDYKYDPIEGPEKRKEIIELKKTIGNVAKKNDLIDPLKPKAKPTKLSKEDESLINSVEARERTGETVSDITDSEDLVKPSLKLKLKPKEELKDTKEEPKTTKEEPKTTKEELKDTKEEPKTTKEELKDTKELTENQRNVRKGIINTISKTMEGAAPEQLLSVASDINSKIEEDPTILDRLSEYHEARTDGKKFIHSINDVFFGSTSTQEETTEVTPEPTKDSTTEEPEATEADGLLLGRYYNLLSDIQDNSSATVPQKKFANDYVYKLYRIVKKSANKTLTINDVQNFISDINRYKGMPSNKRLLLGSLNSYIIENTTETKDSLSSTIDNPSTSQSVTEEIQDAFGTQFENIVILDTISDAPRQYRNSKGKAFITPDNTIYLVADRIQQGTVKNVVLHEKGIHEFLSQSPEFKRAVRGVIRDNPEAVSFVDNEISKGNINPKYREEEIVAYAIENHKESKGVQKLIETIKRFFRRLFKMEMTTADVYSMAQEMIAGDVPIGSSRAGVNESLANPKRMYRGLKSGGKPYHAVGLGEFWSTLKETAKMYTGTDGYVVEGDWVPKKTLDITSMTQEEKDTMYEEFKEFANDFDPEDNIEDSQLHDILKEGYDLFAYPTDVDVAFLGEQGYDSVFYNEDQAKENYFIFGSEVEQGATRESLASTYSKEDAFESQIRDKTKTTKGILGSITNMFKDNISGFIPTFPLIQRGIALGLDKLKGFQATYDRMEFETNTIVEKYKEGLLSDTVEYQKNNPEEYAKVVDMMLQARYTNKEANLDGISDAGMKFYRDTRAFYKKEAELFTESLESLVSGLTLNTDRKKELDRLISKYKKTIEKDSTYFPFARFGENVVRSTKASGDTYVGYYDSHQEATRVAEELRTRGDTNVTISLQRDYMNTAKDEMTANHFNKVQAEIKSLMPDGAKDNGIETEVVSQAMWKLYLNTATASQLRSKGRKAKKVHGASADMTRTIFNTINRDFRNNIKRKYLNELNGQLGAAEADLEGQTGDLRERQRIIRELKERLSLDPKRTKGVSELSKYNFLWHMGFNFSSAITNLTQMPLVAAPVLGSKEFNGQRVGMAKAISSMAKEFSKAARVAWSRGSGDDVYTDRELLIFNTLKKQKVIDTTRAHMMTQLGDGDSGSYNKSNEKFFEYSAWMFHNAEVINRTATAMAAAKLYLDNNEGDINGAIEFAHETTLESHFDYSEFGKGRHLRSNLGTLAFAFQSYSHNMVYFMVRNFTDMIEGESKQIQREAMYKLGSMFGALAVLGGASAMPVFSNIANAILMGGDEPDELKDTWKQILMKGPIAVASGADISSRVSLENPFVHGLQYANNAEGAWETIMKSFLGPIAGYPFRLAQGYDLVDEGKYSVAFDRTMPSAIASLKRSGEAGLINDGLSKSSYDTAKLDYGPSDYVWRALGFNPTDEALLNTYRGAIYKQRKEVATIKKELLRNISLARVWGIGNYGSHMGAIQEYNREASVDDRISRSSIKRSIEAMRDKQRGNIG